MKIAITIIALVLIGAAVVYAYSRSKKQRALDGIYADLRALRPVVCTSSHTPATVDGFRQIRGTGPLSLLMAGLAIADGS